MSRPAWINVGGQDSVGSATVTASTNTLTVVGHGLIDGDIVMVDTLTGGADGPLIPGAVYFVRNVVGDDFQLSGTRGSQIKEYATDGTAEVYVAVPSYNAQALRLNDTVTLFHGSGDGLGAREGVRPGQPGGEVISVAGTTWTVHDHSGVVYPGITATSGPYRYHQTETSDGLDPADGTNDRVDALDELIEDDDEDASGFRQSRVVYVAGTPGGGAPALTPNALRLGTILVPSGGSPAPTVLSLGQFTVASGGILPIQDSSERPISGTYDGMALFNQSTGAMEIRDGADWPIATSIHPPEVEEFGTGGGSFVKADYPWAKYVVVHIQAGGAGGGGAAATGAGQGCVAGGGGGGGYTRLILPVIGLGASETVTVGIGGSGGSGSGNGTGGGSSSFGTHGSATGGEGGEGVGASSGSNIGNGGFGGTGSGGTGGFNVSGGDGSNGVVDNNPTGSSGGQGNHGDGGGSFMTGGSRRTGAATQGSDGVGGRANGGGGSGAHNRQSQVSRTGGDGGPGIVIVEVH